MIEFYSHIYIYTYIYIYILSVPTIKQWLLLCVRVTIALCLQCLIGMQSHSCLATCGSFNEFAFILPCVMGIACILTVVL